MSCSPRDLEVFTDAYIEAALFSTNDESDEQGGEPLDKNYSAGDIAEETMQLIEEDCRDFCERFGDLIANDESRDIDKWGRWSLAGHDFWLTREGHGAGFWDGGWPEHGDELTKAAKSYGSFELYVGDDRRIYGPSPDLYRKRHEQEWYRRLHPPVGNEVRRAAAESLRWRPEHGRGTGQQWWVARTSHGTYGLYPLSRGFSLDYWSATQPAGGQPLGEFATMALAKAAAEEHNAGQPRRRARDNGDDNGNGDDDFDLQSEMEDALIIGDARRGGYDVSFSGKHVGHFFDFDAALKVGVQKMHDSNYFPNVFFVNERGNTDLLSIKEKVIKGKVIKVEYETVRSWV